MCGIEVFILKALHYFNSLVVKVEIKIRTGMHNLNSEWLIVVVLLSFGVSGNKLY